MSRRSILISILFSICLHALIYIGLPTSTFKKPLEQTIAVEILPEQRTPISPVEKFQRTHRPQQAATSKSATKTKRLSTSGFASVLHPQFKSDEVASTENTDAFFEPQSYSFSAKTYDQGNAVRGFTEALYNRVNTRLIFDSILAQYDHFGIVYLEFRVTKTGVLIPESLRASSNDRILQVHVIRSALLPALSEPLKENLWAENDIKLKARFEFKRSHSLETLDDENPERISGLALSFRRFTREGRVARTLGRHLLSGGLNYDAFAMYEAWKKYEQANERERMGTDPFALFRADPYYSL